MRRMASIQKHGRKWRVQVYVNGVRDSHVAVTRAEAAQWALSRESELSGRKLPDRTFGDAMKRYAEEVAPMHRGEKWELTRLTALRKHDIAKRKLAGLAGNDFADWRDARLKKVAPATVAREMNLIRSVLEHARRDWHWLKVNPMGDVKWPTTPPGRRRRVSPAEVDAVVAAFGVGTLAAETATQRVGLAFLFALETAMRAGEIVGLHWHDVHPRHVVLPLTKNGDRREVPLSLRAVEILEVLPKGEGPVFGLDGALRDALWRKLRPKAVGDLHFHDTRAEAIWRLSKRFDVLQLARVIGHRDPRSLMLYYNESAADLAKLLD